MGLLDLLRPGGRKASVERDILRLEDMAKGEADRQGLSPRRAALWRAISQEASGLARELLIHNEDKALDWGLKRHRGRARMMRLATLFWWLLLYELVLLKRRGVEGYDAAEEFEALRQVAFRLMDRMAKDPQVEALNPGPWQEEWTSQYSLEAALGIYNGTMLLLRLYNDTEKRINRVSLFTSATERRFDRNVRGAVAQAQEG